MDFVRSEFGVKTRLQDLSEVIVSHAHIDHFGGAGRFRDMGLPLAIHELDARVLEGFRERLIIASRDVAVFLRRAGMEPAAVADLVDIYQTEKDYFQDLEPDRRLRNGDRIAGRWPILHVPGHCPGMICIAIDDVVLTADHLLSRITPAQRPQSITPFTGLENYLRSLDKLKGWGTFALGLGAHEAPIRQIEQRIFETQTHHANRLRLVLDACRDQPRNLTEITLHLFPHVTGFSLLLAQSEVGAHVEYLHELRYLAIGNLDVVAADYYAAAAYRTIDRTTDPLGLA
jgi:glyoxylase-like metal-dependent hydrolase (beta-lactamase superfamily II)